MRKTSSLIGKSIVHQGSGDRIASVNDVIFDDNAQHAIAMLVNTGGWFREAQIVPWRHVVSIGDVIIVQGELPLVVNAVDSDVVEEWKHDVRLSGTAIISDQGERIGTVGDLFIEDDGNVVGYEVKQGFMNTDGRKFLPIDQVQVIGKDAVLAGSEELQTVAQVRQDSGDVPMNAQASQESYDQPMDTAYQEESYDVAIVTPPPEESYDAAIVTPPPEESYNAAIVTLPPEESHDMATMTPPPEEFHDVTMDTQSRQKSDESVTSAE